jgi:hypothetical protein
MRKNGVQSLLIGGQACVFYGAAEFSRDLDLLILIDPQNLHRLKTALDELDAFPIAVPPFKEEFLRAGHAVHFRCGRPDVAALRIDVMSDLRGGGSFDELWKRRTTLQIEDEIIDLMALEDLVRVKKTQRDKDWPMIRRLVEQNYFANQQTPSVKQIRFWLGELRSPELLIAACKNWPAEARHIAGERPAVAAALLENQQQIEECLAREEKTEREADRAYWRPLREQLEKLRMEARHL